MLQVGGSVLLFLDSKCSRAHPERPRLTNHLPLTCPGTGRTSERDGPPASRARLSLPVLHGAQLKRNIFHQRSAHQETTVLLMSGPADAPLCSPEGLPVRKRSGAWPDARMPPAVFPLLAICAPGGTSARPLRRSVPPKRRPGGQERSRPSKSSPLTSLAE